MVIAAVVVIGWCGVDTLERARVRGHPIKLINPSAWLHQLHRLPGLPSRGLDHGQQGHPHAQAEGRQAFRPILRSLGGGLADAVQGGGEILNVVREMYS